MSRFLDDLHIRCYPGNDALFILDHPLRYESDLLGCTVAVPKDFVTDLASIPGHIKWCHREAVIHDYLYKTDSTPPVNQKTADRVLLEAMTAQGKCKCVKMTVYSAVRLFGKSKFHQHPIIVYEGE